MGTAAVKVPRTPEEALAAADEAQARADLDAVVAHLSAAIRGFTTADQVRQAALACARLGDVFASWMGALTVARAWFARATRLVEDEPPCLEQGWVALAAMGCDVDDPADLLARADLALDRARRFGDLNLETKALADGGLALVRAGRVDEGMQRLDEAMALACGPADDLDVTAKSVCSFFTACYHAAAFDRASTWADVLRRQGLIGDAPTPSVFLSSHCDAVQAVMLVEVGRWGDAEALLTAADARFRAALGIPSWHPAIHLADLRIRQGRLTDAETLLLGKDQAIEALVPAARLHLARGHHDLARAVIDRGLQAIGDDLLRSVELRAMLVEAHLGAGDVAAAQATSEALHARLDDVGVPALRARAALATARVTEASGDVLAAIAALETALPRLDPAAIPWLRAVVHLELAALREQAGQLDLARAEAATAAAILADLDVVLPARAAATLARLDGAPSPADAVSLRRDGRWWVVQGSEGTVRLRDTKGLRYLAELIAHPGVERHALDLVDRAEGPALAGQIDRRSLGDAGPLVDGQARAAYRLRVEELRESADDALSLGDLARAERIQRELDEVVHQLAAAFGLGGRARVAGSAAERARLNVTRALRGALRGISDAIPGAGPWLDRRIRTGTYCRYEPEPADPVRWIVQS